ncbi:MAG: RND family transporter [Thermoplasmatales archaeon]|nr:RND family transporter [Thermoplasmatales archaeon]
MLDRVGRFVEKRTVTIIAIAILITLIFSSFLPFINMSTSLNDFLPDSEVVRAERRVREYFGDSSSAIMVYIENDNVLKPSSLREIYNFSKEIGNFNCLSIAGLVDIICNIEYGKNLINCSDEEIINAFQDLMYEKSYEEIKIGENKKDGAKIYSAYVKENDTKIFFSIESFQIPKNSYRQEYEWFIEFNSKIGDNSVPYKISARDDLLPIWVFGAGLKENLKKRDKEENVYIWVFSNGTYFPVKLNESKFYTSGNRVVIEIDKDELGKFGIGKFGSMELPSKLTEIKIGLRKYKFPWFGFAIDEKIVGMDFLNHNISLKDIDKLWSEIDSLNSSFVLFLKPEFMDEMKNSALMILSKDYEKMKAKSTIVLFQINSSDFDSFYERLRNIKREEFKITGEKIISNEINEMTDKSNRIIGIGIFIAIAFLLFLDLRKISYVILSFAGLFISLIWTFGTMSILNINFNALYVAIMPLIMGLGVDYSIHLFHRYINERNNGKRAGEAIANAIANTGTALFLATITTCIGFLSFLTATIPPLRYFGFLCAIGIIYTFIVTITLLASVRYFIDKKDDFGLYEKKSFSFDFLIKKQTNFVVKKPKIVILFFSIFTIIMLFSMGNVKTGFRIEEFLPEESPSIKTLNKINENFPFFIQSEDYIIIEENVTKLKTLKEIKEMHKNMKDDEFILKTPDGGIKVLSVVSLIEDAVKKNRTIAEKFNIGEDGLPKSDEDVKNIYDYLYENKEYKNEIRRVLHRKNGEYDASLIIIYNNAISSGGDVNKNIEKFYNQLKEDILGNAIITGPTILTYTITSSLVKNQIKSTLICIILSIIILAIIYKDFILGFLNILPVGIASIWIVGSMALMNYSLNVMTIMVTSLTIGLGITYSIHITDRFRKSDKSKESMFEILSSTGSAIVGAALTTIAGFSMLIFSPMPPERQFGVIMCLTILYSFIASITLLPSILLLRKK